MTLQIDKKINAEIDACNKCAISRLRFNVRDLSKGYGKLCGWRGSDDVDFFFVGMNPSYRRFANIKYAFGGSSFDKGTGVEFVKILDGLGVKNRSAIDNLCHCSTESNSISALNALNCFPFLLQEIKLLDPIKIIAMGDRTFDFIEQLIETNSVRLLSKLVKIHHPNFAISYRRDLLNDYILEIKKCISE